MRSLTIGYVLNGARAGYNFTSGTDGIDPATLKAVWQGAMPRGQGWDAYPGATALKCFPLDSGEAAICDVTVTDMTDEAGRKGIREATIHLMTAREYDAALLERLHTLPASIVSEAERKLHSREWELLFKKYRRAQKPKSFVKPTTILAYPLASGRAFESRSGDANGDWRFVEACILLLATRSTLLTNLIEISPSINPFADRILSFTTLALDYQEGGRIVALPLEKIRSFDGIPYIDLSA